jgi:hypothetical protein
MRALAIAAIALAGCRGGAAEQQTAVQEETPEDEILRIGRVWQSVSEAKGLRSAPDPVSVFEIRTRSTLTFEPGKPSAREQVVVAERFELRSGGKFVCESGATLQNSVRFGRYRGEAAIELRRAGATIERTCDPPGFPDLELEIEAGGARFVLRSDQLVAFAPPLEKRIYLPIE